MKRKVVLYFMFLIVLTLTLVMVFFGIGMKRYFYQEISDTVKIIQKLFYLFGHSRETLPVFSWQKKAMQL